MSSEEKTMEDLENLNLEETAKVDEVEKTVEKKKVGRPKGSTKVEEQKKPEEDSSARFLQVETFDGDLSKSLNIYNENPLYVYHWCAKSKMANSRRGIWHTVPRNHPDFKGLRVENDHSPDQSFFSCGDLILCCARKETVAAIRKMKAERIKARDVKLDTQTKEVLRRVGKEGVKSLSNKTMEMIEAD